MKISFDRKALKSNLELLKMAQKPNPTMPVLNYIKMGAVKGYLVAMASSLEVSIRIILCKAEGDPFILLVNFSDMLSILNKSTEENVTLEFKDNGITLFEGLTGEYFFPKEGNADEFPVFQKIEGDTHDLTINGTVLKNAISFITPCIGSDDTQAFMNGVVVAKHENSIEILGTNGHQIAIKTICDAPETFEGVIWPKRFTTLLSKLLADAPVTLKINDKNTMAVISNSTIIHVRNLEGKIPSYRNIIYKPETLGERITFKREELQAAVDKASIIYNTVSFSMRNSTAVIESENVELSRKATNKISVNSLGKLDSLLMSVNATYFMNMLQISSDETISLEMYLYENYVRAVIYRTPKSIYMIACVKPNK